MFAAVSNPTRRVLLLSDVVARADDGASLSVDAVGQNYLRVSGTTASRRAGTPRDGHATPSATAPTTEGARVEGEATVYLLPPRSGARPHRRRRHGRRARRRADRHPRARERHLARRRATDAQSRRRSPRRRPTRSRSPPATCCDTSPPTSRANTRSSTPSSRPGLPRSPTPRRCACGCSDEDANRAPAAETLEGRVLSGQSTLVAFDGFGMDPDGDVVTLDRIVEQPERGSATISPDGTSIVYASVPGHRGQVSFRYRVVDAFGATGEGTVRIGVLDGQSNPSPITFTDYVQVQAGTGNSIRVSPLSNDVDPTLGTLTLTDVRPDLPATLVDGSENAEYARLADRILSTDDTTVVDRGRRGAGDDVVPLRHRVELGQHRPRAHRGRGRARERARLPRRRRHGPDRRDPRGLPPRRRRARRQGHVVRRRRRGSLGGAVGRAAGSRRRRRRPARTAPRDDARHPVRRHGGGRRRARSPPTPSSACPATTISRWRSSPGRRRPR